MYSKTDCQDYKDAGYNESGVYHVKPLGTHFGFKVYCDMITDDGGWLVRIDKIIITLSLSPKISKPHIFFSVPLVKLLLLVLLLLLLLLILFYYNQLKILTQ